MDKEFGEGSSSFFHVNCCEDVGKWRHSYTVRGVQTGTDILYLVELSQLTEPALGITLRKILTHFHVE